MSFKTIFVTAILTLSPIVALAQSCHERHDQQAMSCAEGMVWDEATSTCVTQTTS